MNTWLSKLWRRKAVVQGASCPVCGAVQAERISGYQGRHDLFRSLSILECRECGHAFAYPPVDEKALEFYNREFFVNSVKGMKFEGEAVDWFPGVARLRWEYIRKVVDLDWLPKALFEVGPGAGFFPEVLRSLGLKFRYSSLEADESCRNHLASKQLSSMGMLDEVPEENDFLVASHVMEHVNDPVGFLRAMSSKLLPGAVVFIEVPCRDFEYKEIVEPHLLFFTRESMRKLFSRLGWEVLSIDYFGQTIAELKKNKSSRDAAIQGVWSLPLEPWASQGQKKVIEKLGAHAAQEKAANWVRAVGRIPGRRSH